VTAEQDPSPQRGSPPNTKLPTTFILATIIALAALALAVLAIAALDGGTRSFDEWLLRGLRETTDPAVPLGPRWFQEMVRDVSALGSTGILTLIVVIVTGYLLVIRSIDKALFLVAAVTLGTLLNRVLKLLIARPRPDIVPHATYVSNESFPSGHAANSAIVYLVLGLMLAALVQSPAAKRYVFAVCVFITTIVGLSRIYLGVHWPSDVIAGWLVGGIWALLCWVALTRINETTRAR